MKIPAWSFSSLTKFETCPRQYHIVRVLKRVIEPPTVHTEWGKEVHSALEYRVKDGTPLPEKMQGYEKIAMYFDGKPAFTELQLSITRNMQPTGWFDSDCWYRGIIDVGIDYGTRAFLGDYKTGKVKKDFDQMNLFAATYMTIHPQVEVSRAAYIWLGHDTLTRKEIKREEVPVIWQDFMSRSRRLEVAYEKDKWPPKPSGLCRGWCPVGRENCEFWSPKKNS